MGHQRLGEIPKTQKWKKVVEKITSEVGASPSGQAAPQVDVAQIAYEILIAGEGGLAEATKDPGLQSTVYLLTQIVLSARQEDWQAGLAAIGLKLDKDASVFDLTGEVQRVIDEDVRRHGRPTTVGEIARQAAGEALAELTRDEAISLFGSGARASRTTHPKALHDFQRLYSLVLDRQFIVDNPFIYKTKKEVLELIRKHGQAGLIRYSCSCAHQGPFQSKTHWHCGWCSQCIDRRFAILAAGLEGEEDAFDYKIDVFTGNREKSHEQNIAIGYVRHATELFKMSAEEIATRFNREISGAFRYCPDPRDAPRRLVELHQRHAEAVHSVLRGEIARQASAIIDGSIAEKSLVVLAASRKHLMESWRRYAERIKEALRRGLPPICRKQPPDNEPRLQEICDGVLKAASLELDREYPYMKWASALTKPDWSREELGLWVEAKYARKKEGLAKITDAIAADIMKYGDSGRRTLYFVYDPDGIIIDQAAFKKPILARETMDVFIFR